MGIFTIELPVGDPPEDVEFTAGLAGEWLDVELSGNFRGVRFATIQEAAEFLYNFNGQTFGGLVLFEDESWGVYVGHGSY